MSCEAPEVFQGLALAPGGRTRAHSARFGGKVGIAPRIFLKKLVADLLDRIELFRDFKPRSDYRLTVREDELSEEERNLTPAGSVNDIALNL